MGSCQPLSEPCPGDKARRPAQVWQNSACRSSRRSTPISPPAQMLPGSPRFFASAAIGGAMAVIFIIDTFTLLGLGVSFLYLLVTLFAIRIQVGSRALLAIVGVSTVLAAARLGIPSAEGIPDHAQGNRLIFAVLIWTLLAMELARRRREAERMKMSRKLEELVKERTDALHRANRELQTEVAERKQAEKNVKDYAERLHGLAGQLVEAQENERRQLAAELHDRIGQNLSVLNINLSLNLAQVLPHLPADQAAPVAERIRDSLQLVEKTAETVRSVMEELRPNLLDQYGLEAALRWHGEEFTSRTGIRVAMEATESFPRLRAKVETVFFRIAQEALVNAAKHSRASCVTISLARTPSGIGMVVADDGVGFHPEAVRGKAVGSGWGLPLMTERARSIGAAIQIHSELRRGTRVVTNISNQLWEVA